MKTVKSILVVMMILTSVSVNAQRKAGGLAIQGKFGLMEGRGQMNNFWGAFPEGQATSFSLGINRLQGNKGAMFETNVFVNDFYVDEDNLNLPYRLIGLNILGGWSYEKMRFIDFNFKVGVFAGNEKINNGKITENEYQIPLKKSVSNFTYGAVFNPEMEFKIWANLHGILAFSQYYYIGSKYADWKYSVDLGVKWYL